MRHQAVGLHRCCRPSRLHPRKHDACNLSTRYSFPAAFFLHFVDRNGNQRGVYCELWRLRQRTTSRSRLRRLHWCVSWCGMILFCGGARLSKGALSLPRIAPVSPCAPTLRTRRSSAPAVAISSCDERSAVQKHQKGKRLDVLKVVLLCGCGLGRRNDKFPTRGMLVVDRSACSIAAASRQPQQDGGGARGGGWRLEEGISELGSIRPETGVSRVRSG